MSDLKSSLSLAKQKKIALLTEYDGSLFYGWQYQPEKRTVQKVLADALLELTGEEQIQLVGCSRTDAGVHARGHVSHFTTFSRIPEDRWPLALNRILPSDVSVREAVITTKAFHARRHACGKIYSYQIFNDRIRPAINRQYLTHVPGKFDLDAMMQAVPYLIGRHDFRAFCDTGSSAVTTVRTIKKIRLLTKGPYIRFYFQGDGFLYHMVRIMVGTLLAVAQNKLEAATVEQIIQTKDRRLAGKTMPPEGLCLEHVIYEPALFSKWREPVSEEGELDVQYEME